MVPTKLLEDLDGAYEVVPMWVTSWAWNPKIGLDVEPKNLGFKLWSPRSNQWK
jgi:hypothetical protein